MKVMYIIGGAAALGAGLLAYRAWKGRQAALAAAAPAAAPQVAAAQGVAPPAQQAAHEGQGGLPKLPSSLGTLATVAAGVKVQNVIGNVAEAVGGEGAGNVARVAPAVVGAGVIIGKGVQRGLEAVGVANEPSRVAGVVAGVAVVAGAPVAVAALTTQVAGSLLQEGLKAVAGEKVERAVSNAVSQFDPFKPDSLANKAVQPVANAVSFVGGLFGKDSEEEKRRQEAERAAAQAQASAVLAKNPAAAQQVASAAGKPGGLLQVVKAVAPLPPAPMPVAPPAPPSVERSVAAPTKAPAVVSAVARGPLAKFGGLAA